MARTAFVAVLLAGTAFAQQTDPNSGKEAFSGWSLTEQSKAAGYSLGMTTVDGVNLAVMTPPVPVADDIEANVTVKVTAASFRGHTARFTAWLRISEPGPRKHARIWIQADRAEGLNGPLDNLTSKAVGSSEWTLADVAIGVAADANSLTFGVLAEGGARVEIRGESLNNVALPISEMPSIQLPPPPNTTADLPALGPDRIPEPPAVTDLLPPDLPEKQKIIQAAARVAIQYVRNLPDFLCTETIRRAENDKHKGWKQRDVLAIRLRYSGGIERYRLMSINGKPSSATVDSLKGGMSAGEFGSLLAEVFTPHTAAFDWDHWALLRGRTVSVFRYTVPLEKSKFRLYFQDNYHPGEETISAFHGSVYIDKETNEVLRLVEIADPPAGFALRESSQVVDYDHLDVGGREFLLPTRSENFIASAVLASHNLIEFRDYQKFSADSKVQFE